MAAMTLHERYLYDAGNGPQQGNSNDVMLRQHLSVTFHGEPGTWLGPQRELFALLPAEICKPERMLFTATEQEEGVFMPTAVWSKVINVDDDDDDDDNGGEESGGASGRGGGGAAASAVADLSNAEEIVTEAVPGGATAERPERLLELGTVGLLIGLALWHGLHLNLKLSTVCVAQLLGRAVNHPADLEHVDPTLYQSMMWVVKNDPEVLELKFVDDIQVQASPTPDRRGGGGSSGGAHAAAGGGGSKGAAAKEVVTVALDRTGRIPPDTAVTKENALQYVQLKSELRLVRAVASEVEALRNGMLRVVDAPLLKLFTELEFLLLLNGASNIPVDDWRAHTAFTGGEHPRIEGWFWQCVGSFSQSERCGLLQFATGCSTLPPDGFAGLKSLDPSSTHNFTVSVGSGLSVDALPTSSTCFNLLKIPMYPSHHAMRNKLLSAIRYGKEGFEFS